MSAERWLSTSDVFVCIGCRDVVIRRHRVDRPMRELYRQRCSGCGNSMDVVNLEEESADWANGIRCHLLEFCVSAKAGSTHAICRSRRALPSRRSASTERA